MVIIISAPGKRVSLRGEKVEARLSDNNNNNRHYHHHDDQQLISS